MNRRLAWNRLPGVGCLLIAFHLALTPCARAAVFLTLEDAVGPASAVTVAPGDSFTLTTYLHITAGEQLTTVDYYFETLAAGSGLFSIAGRTIGASQVTTSEGDYVSTNAQVANPIAALLDPRNDRDLGSIADTTLLTGLYLHATYTFTVAPAAASGTYTLQTFSFPGTGWSDENFNDQAFSVPGTYAVTVVPEPTPLALAAMACLYAMAAGAGRCIRRLRKGEPERFRRG